MVKAGYPVAWQHRMKFLYSQTKDLGQWSIELSKETYLSQKKKTMDPCLRIKLITPYRHSGCVLFPFRINTKAGPHDQEFELFS